MYVVLIDHTYKTNNVLILLCVLILICPILVVYYRAKYSDNIALFCLKYRQNTGLAPLTSNNDALCTGKSVPFILFSKPRRIF